MSLSRASANAKLLQLHHKRQSAATAKSFSALFTQKQSHFERRREEEQVKHQLSQAPGGTLQHPNSEAETVLSRRTTSAWNDAARSRFNITAGAFEAPSPFSLASARDSTRGSPQAAVSTVSAATLGLNSASRPRLHITRSARRAGRFNLNADEHEGGMAMAARKDGADAAGGDVALGRGLLGAVVRPPAADGEGEKDGSPPRKLTREERFREVMASSKQHRAQQQRERAHRDAEATALDTEFNALLHLLQRRDKEGEERLAFERSGTAEVRALLKAYKKGHVAKQLRLKASGQFTVAPLCAPNEGVTPPEEKGDVATRKRQREGSPAAGPAAPAKGDFLSAGDRELLLCLRAGGTRSAEEKPLAAVAASGSASGVVPPSAIAAPDAEDDFDELMNHMRLDTRRAHATERTLAEEEQEELLAQQELLEADRRAVPSLGLQERDLAQVTRAEWIRQGGDQAFHMDGGGAESGDADDDGLDIPSSYEGDSDVDVASDDGGRTSLSSADEDGAEEKGQMPTSPSAAVLGSVTLDRIMAELEALATDQGSRAALGGKRAEGGGEALVSGASPADRGSDPRPATSPSLEDAYLQLLRRLHRYARSHLLDVASVFRLILAEAERSFLRGPRRALGRPLLLCLFTLSRLFPSTDYRHEVVTPFHLFLCSTLMQMKLDSLESVHSYVGLNAMLTQSLRAGGGKYAAEAVVAALNVLALQLPRSVLEPAKYQGVLLPLPLVERCEAALLAEAPTTGAQGGGGEAACGPAALDHGLDARWRMFETQHCAMRLVLCAYHQLEVLADLYRDMAAFPAVLEVPFAALDRLLRVHHPDFSAAGDGPAGHGHAAVRRAHEALAQRIAAIAAAAQQRRTPLAMRTFRPRPIRQFEPLLAEREESAVKSEIREMRRGVREDKKRVMRHLTAEATVQRRAREKEQTAQKALRERRYNQLMGQLQAQQHLMKTVDTMLTKAKSRPKKAISGAPRAPLAGGAE